MEISSALLGPQIGTDALGRPVYSGEIFNPNTLRYVNGQPVRDPFQVMNVIPQSLISQVGANIAASVSQSKHGVRHRFGPIHRESGFDG